MNKTDEKTTPLVVPLTVGLAAERGHLLLRLRARAIANEIGDPKNFETALIFWSAILALSPCDELAKRNADYCKQKIATANV